MAASTPGHQLADLAALLADTTRATFCLALMDGRAWTASELAAHAGVAVSTASEHLHRLVAAGLLSERRHGRHRYVQLAGPQAATLLEDLTAFSSAKPPQPKTLREATASSALARARTCYDHVAGQLGVAITDAMIDARLISTTGGFALTDAGSDFLASSLAADLSVLQAGRRPLARPCLDWTERRTHLAGAAGAHVYRHLTTQGWIKRIGSGRAVRVTPPGVAALRDLFGLDWTQVATTA